ncbi:MAG: hypothetical protein NW218_13755 [Saprospiraceae bacterium]|nr:hypothetical protein [Saprospiraceae bacterium]
MPHIYSKLARLMYKIDYFRPFLLIFWALTPFWSAAQTTSQTSFGKNRVQYHHQFDDWLLYETNSFTTYWYGDARNVAQAALQTAELDFPMVQQLLEHQMTDKIEMLVFSDITDLKQSNIGEDDLFLLRAGETKVVGNKIFVYFDGDHRHLRAQIREGVAGVLINSMLYGANLQEIVQNAVLLNLPGWYTEGLGAYCGEEWNAGVDNQLRDILMHKKFANFDRFAKAHPRLAGQAFWYYIGLHYGKGTISNLLYLTRINRSIDAGFLYVLGSGYRRTTDALLTYFINRYEEEKKLHQLPEKKGLFAVKNKKERPLYHVKISPDGKKIAWVSNNLGSWRVYVADVSDGKRKLLMRGGVRNALQTTDYNYPQLAWNPDNQRLSVLVEQRDQPKLVQIEVKTGKREHRALSPEFQRVFSMDHISPTEIVFSAAVKGYSDLFIYRTVTRQTERITQDFWDDLDVSYAHLDGHKGILFASNRISDTLSLQKLDSILPLGRFDLFFFDLETRSPELIRITQTPFTDESSPISIDSSHYAFLSTENGIVNRAAGELVPYLAYNQAVIYLKDGSEIKALDTKNLGEWSLARISVFLAPVDTVLKNVDSTQIDSIKFMPVYKKRAKTWNQTNYDRNLTELHGTIRSGKMVEVMRRERKTLFYVRKSDPTATQMARITRAREIQLNQIGAPIPLQPKLMEAQQNDTAKLGPAEDRNLRKDTVPVIQPGWYFQVPEYLKVPAPAVKPKATTPKPVEPALTPGAVLNADSMLFPPGNAPRLQTRPWVEMGKQNSVIRFNPSRIIPYRLRFRTDYISTTVDNNLLFGGLDSYAGSPDGFKTPPPGVLLRANFKDLLEDYVVEAGFRLPTTFNGAEYYLWFDNKKKRLDKRIALYRKTVVNAVDESLPGSAQDPSQVRTNTVLAQYELRYPLDPFFSLRAMATLRQDKAITLSTNNATLETPNYAEQRAGIRLSAVYDNTEDVDLNLRTGTRVKVWVESVKRFDINSDPNFSIKLNKGFMTVIGIDARHYQPLDKRSILALRFAAGTSFGSEKMLYFLGGVDNWLFPKFNNNIPLPEGENFAFQTLASNIRGFNQNIRNGNSHALLNAELRVPIFKYFSRKPVMGNFWRNFQIVGFFDVGSAWQGRSPYGGNNPINIVYLTDGPVGQAPVVTVKVNYFRDPLVAGYGVGARATIFGMYLRADYGWGIETRVVQKPILHLALGTDF